jgi:hypothetical protein
VYGGHVTHSSEVACLSALSPQGPSYLGGSYGATLLPSTFNSATIQNRLYVGSGTNPCVHAMHLPSIVFTELKSQTSGPHWPLFCILE